MAEVAIDEVRRLCLVDGDDQQVALRDERDATCQYADRDSEPVMAGGD
jgi:hypothetical protein